MSVCITPAKQTQAHTHARRERERTYALLADRHHHLHHTTHTTHCTPCTPPQALILMSQLTSLGLGALVRKALVRQPKPVRVWVYVYGCIYASICACMHLGVYVCIACTYTQMFPCMRILVWNVYAYPAYLHMYLSVCTSICICVRMLHPVIHTS